MKWYFGYKALKLLINLSFEAKLENLEVQLRDYQAKVEHIRAESLWIWETQNFGL